ncbi:hypothetical protein LCGC14_0105830 [marine sediment metagenome]|uniref:Uncharacterized protein n=2 Tax=root TaxID=1 RepID=A0A7V1FLS3_9RHOB|nr:hypothetical protein [Sulfitobacter litoralis]HDY95193.1 hypothetical protein [Sulfitobacter litoralis]HDZ50867.1 hypothetical protein [Sulfitobacter litoralis]
MKGSNESKRPKGVVEVLSGQPEQTKIRGVAAREVQKETERNNARNMIYSALSRWVGETVEPYGDIPLVRDGVRIGTMQQTLLGQGRDVEYILAASKLLKASDLRKLREDLRKLSEMSDSLTTALMSLDLMDLLSLDTVPKAASHDTEVKVIRAVGTVSSTFIALADLKTSLDQQAENIQKKLSALTGQRGRPKNEATHGVAVRLAKLYARVTGRRPTYSEGPNGLSGEYTPALRSVFDALGWESVSLKSPAEAAIAQISEQDLQPYINALSYGLSSYRPE